MLQLKAGTAKHKRAASVLPPLMKGNQGRGRAEAVWNLLGNGSRGPISNVMGEMR
jgi:hypothetical protein